MGDELLFKLLVEEDDEDDDEIDEDVDVFNDVVSLVSELAWVELVGVSAAPDDEYDEVDIGDEEPDEGVGGNNVLVI